MSTTLADKKKRTYHIETYGCQMNEYDSLIAKKILEDEQIQNSQNIASADYILLNTCAIRENAHQKVYNKLSSLKQYQKKGAKIILLGCMAQNLKEDLLQDQVIAIDYIIGPDSLREIKSIVNSTPTFKNDKTTLSRSHVRLSKTEVYEDIIPSVEQHLSTQKSKTTAFISIQRGCDNFCTFCVVPFTRGRERSRSADSIIEEVRHLVENGIQTVVLLGQNVNSYLYRDLNFVSLVRCLLKETNIFRIYFTSPHPKDFPLELIELMENNSRFCNHVHIPIQSGSNQILKKMRRNYTIETVLDLVDSFREKVPNIAITTDVIVGFPTETDDQFFQTLDFMKKVKFDAAFMFAYSERKGTSAQSLYDDDISREVKQYRLSTLIDTQMKISLQTNQNYIGRTVNALVESNAKKDQNSLLARLNNGKKVVFPSELSLKEMIGKEVRLKILDVTSQTLISKLLT